VGIHVIEENDLPVARRSSILRLLGYSGEELT
jgi:hypothetical protein